MTDKLTLGCSECDFKTTEPEAFVTHMLLTGHAHAEGAIGAESGDVMELVRAISAIQTDPEGRNLPEGMEVKPVSLEEIMEDPDLPDSEKAKILAFFDKADEIE